MIQNMKNLADGVIGFELSGKVSGEDYETILIPTIEKKLKEQNKVRVLYYIDSDFKSYEFSAMIDDAKAGLMFFSAWEKIAVVSDLAWITTSIKALSFVIPGEIKVYKISELEMAKEWLGQEVTLHSNLTVSFMDEAKIAILEPHGSLSKDDFLYAKTIIDPFLQTNEMLNGLIIYTKDFPGWDSFSALVTHMKFVKEHHKHIKKLAFVTDSTVGEIGEKIASHFVNAEIKNFDYDELGKAKSWIGEV